MSMGPEERVRLLLEAARRIADPQDVLGLEARRTLPASTGLSPENVELCLSECLETNPSQEEIAALLRSVRSAPQTHVVLSAGVFVAAHRAIALALAASPRPKVRPSRREPEMARLLSKGAPDLFDLVTEMVPAPGDQVFAYGSDETMRTLSLAMPAGAVLHAHGSGIGVVVVDLETAHFEAESPRTAAAIARDVVPFDQRGCLSPRLVLVKGSAAAARAFAERLAHALADLELEIPLGAVHRDERADLVRHRGAWVVAGEVFSAGSGSVSFDAAASALSIPPPGRNVHVRWSPDIASAASELSPLVTSVAVEGPGSFRDFVRGLFPDARLARVGKMQRPLLDGPVDRRRWRNTT